MHLITELTIDYLEAHGVMHDIVGLYDGADMLTISKYILLNNEIMENPTKLPKISIEFKHNSAMVHSAMGRFRFEFNLEDPNFEIDKFIELMLGLGPLKYE